MKTRSRKRLALLTGGVVLIGLSLAGYLGVKNEQRQYARNRQLIAALSGLFLIHKLASVKGIDILMWYIIAILILVVCIRYVPILCATCVVLVPIFWEQWRATIKYNPLLCDKIFVEILQGKLVPTEKNIVFLPSEWACAALGGKVYITYKDDGLICVVFPLNPGTKWPNFSGVMYCNRPLAPRDGSPFSRNPDGGMRVEITVGMEYLDPEEPFLYRNLPVSFYALDRKKRPEETTKWSVTFYDA